MSLLRNFAVPVLLVAVAVNHIYRHHAFRQSAWGAGCGFGMFSTVDYHDSRYFRCYLVTDRGKSPARFAPHFAAADMKARVLPTSANLTDLATKLADARWDTADGTIVCDSSAKTVCGPIKGVRLELHRIQLNPTSRVLTSELLDHVELARDENQSR